jgi:hypothetical protein
VSINTSIVEPITDFPATDPLAKNEEQGNGDEYSDQKQDGKCGSHRNLLSFIRF